MADHDYGPLRTYEVHWLNREPEVVQGHSVLFEGHMAAFGSPSGRPKVKIFGMFPGDHWRLVLLGLEEDIRSIRDITDQVAELEAMNGGDGA